MRVAVDMISAGSGFGSSTGGMIVYYAGLLAGLCDVPSIGQIVPLVSPWNEGLAIPHHTKVDARTCSGLPRSRLGRVTYEQVVLPEMVRRLDVDVLLSTCNIKPFLWRGPSVVVLQSLQYLHFPEQFGRARRTYLKHGVRSSLHAADAVIAVTDWERSEAIRLFGLEPEQVFTVYHGLSGAVAKMRSAGEMPRPSGLVGDQPYVVMVSSLYRFKNHARLIEAFAGLVHERRVPHRLVLIGGDADVTRSELSSLAARLGVGDRIVLPGAVPHDDVPALIAHSDAVAYVSLYETFGHPVIEALAAGRPLVTSDHGAIAEVAGGAARLVDATSVDSITAGLADVLLDETVRGQLAEAGPRRASTFTWEACANKTAAVLDVAINRHREALRGRRLTRVTAERK